MCCRLTVYPLPQDWQDILRIAGFSPPDPGGFLWHRELAQAVFAFAVIQSAGWCREERVFIRLSPSIGMHDMGAHRLAAPLAAVTFKLAMTLAEASHGVIRQQSMLGECLLDAGDSTRVIAEYPERPLRFENVCLGFREVMLAGLPQIGEQGNAATTSRA